MSKEIRLPWYFAAFLHRHEAVSSCVCHTICLKVTVFRSRESASSSAVIYEKNVKQNGSLGPFHCALDSFLCMCYFVLYIACMCRIVTW